MNTYKKSVIIDNSKQLTLSDLPFVAGQKVEVIIMAEEEQDEVEERLAELRKKIDLGTEQILSGQLTDGEKVFEELQEKLQREYELD